MKNLALALLLSAAADPRAIYSDAVAALQGGNPEIARDLFAQAAKLAPEWALPQLELGVILLAQEGALEGAITALEAAVRLNPDNPRAAYQLALAYKKATRFKEAASTLQHCVALRPRWLDAWLALGEALEGSGDPVGALRPYEQVRALDPTHLGAIGRLADLYERQGEPSQAEACWLQIVHANPTAAYYAYQLGQFYTRIGDKPKARAALTRAAALDPRPARKMRQLR